LKGCAEIEKNTRAAGVERPRAPSVEKNKLPGEAVREPGALWGSARVLPRKEPDTVSSAVTSTTFVVTVSTCLAFRSGGRLPLDRSELRRTGGERRNSADNNGKTRQVRPGQLIAENLRRFQWNRKPLALTRSHAIQSKVEKQIYQSVRFE